MDDIVRFHDFLLWLIAAIALFVLVLLVIVMVRFNARANPVPVAHHAQHLHRGLWTVVPMLILVAIAVPSFRLLFDELKVPQARPDGEGDRQAVVLELQLSRTASSSSTR